MNRPGIEKTDHFQVNFPHTLDQNDWLVRWPVKGLKWKTYNPDFWCDGLKCFIECCTSLNNYSDSLDKWNQCLKQRRAFRIYWWQGQEITEFVKARKMPSSIPFIRRNDDSPLADPDRPRNLRDHYQNALKAIIFHDPKDGAGMVAIARSTLFNLPQSQT